MYVSAMVFGSGILGGVHKIWDNPYLNSTTVLLIKENLQSHLEANTLIHMYWMMKFAEKALSWLHEKGL